MGKDKINIRELDRFRPKLYADLYIPSYMNGYSIAMEFMYNYFMSRFPKNYFNTIHIVGKYMLDDFRRYEYGDRIKREVPMVSIASKVEPTTDFDMIDIHLFGIDRYMMKTDMYRSFFKDYKNKLFLGLVSKTMMVNFAFRLRFETLSLQMDMFNKMNIMFRIGCTTTMDIDADFHIPYNLMSDVAKDAGFQIDANGRIINPYDFLAYLNRNSHIPFLYKLRYINGKREFFIRMMNLPVHIDTRDQPDMDDGEQIGQTSNNYHIDMNIKLMMPVPNFYIYYSEGKVVNDIKLVEPTNVSVYSMRVMDIPDINDKGWNMYATSNYLKDKNEKVIKEIDISTLFKSPVDNSVGISLDDLIEDAIQNEISPSAFIDIDIYSNDISINSGKIPIKVDWKNRKILFPNHVENSYLYIIIYTEMGYINDKIIDKDGLYKTRMWRSKQTNFTKDDNYDYDPVIEEPNNRK